MLFCLLFLLAGFLFAVSAPSPEAKLTPPVPAAETSKPAESAAEAAASDLSTESSPLCPAGTFTVIRLRDFASLERAIEDLKKWTHEHPSVESIFDEDEWKKIQEFNLREKLAETLELTQKDFDEYFQGAITICISGDFELAKQKKTLPVAMATTAGSPEKALEFTALLKSEEDVLETSQEAEGVDRVRIRGEEVADPSTKVKKAVEPMDVYLATVGPLVIVGNNLDYTLAARAAALSSTTLQNAFWSRSASADLAAWVDPRPFFRLLKDQLEAKSKAQEDAATPSAKVSSQIVDDLGLNEIEGIGIRINFSPVVMQMQIDTVDNPTGVAKLFSCLPSGITATSLIPVDADEFSISRLDIPCLWGELRRLAKIAMPASETMYEGWKKQIQTDYGIDFDRQFIGSFGDRVIAFSSPDESENMAYYIAINDAVSFQGGLDSVIGFFTQGKSPFEKEKIGATTVWRLKSESQAPDAPAVAYAITPQWLIVSVGDPTQMQDLIEAASLRIDRPLNKILESPQAKEVLSNPNLISFSSQSLKVVLSEASIAARQAKLRHQGDKANDDEIQPPSFDDVKSTVMVYTEVKPGSVISTLKIIPNEE